MKNNNCNKEIHAYQNEDGTYRVEINKDDISLLIEKADINIVAYATNTENWKYVNLNPYSGDFEIDLDNPEEI